MRTVGRLELAGSDLLGQVQGPVATCLDLGAFEQVAERWVLSAQEDVGGLDLRGAGRVADRQRIDRALQLVGGGEPVGIGPRRVGLVVDDQGRRARADREQVDVSTQQRLAERQPERDLGTELRSRLLELDEQGGVEPGLDELVGELQRAAAGSVLTERR